MLGFLFGMGQAQANIWIHTLTPLLNAALGYQKELPARKPCDIERILSQCPGLSFIIDATERPIQRPKDAERQKDHYSGKKRRHTVKNTVVGDKSTRKIKVLGQTHPGKKHDKKMAEERRKADMATSSVRRLVEEGDQTRVKIKDVNGIQPGRMDGGRVVFDGKKKGSLRYGPHNSVDD